MTDLSNMTLAELEAEIERRKAEPDYAVWAPKWQAFREVMSISDTALSKHKYIRALIAAHNTPLTGEEWTEYRPPEEGVGPAGVSPETHEINWLNQPNRWLPVNITLWRRGRLYRYRLKQTDGWIPWAGGECPVSGNTLVDAKLRNGIVRRGSACVWYWLYDGPEESQVIAYRVVKEP